MSYGIAKFVVGGGWLRTAQNFTNHGDYDVYVKKNPVPKVTAPKSNQMSVLDNPTTKVRTFDGGNYDATEWQFGKGALFLSHTPNLTPLTAAAGGSN